MSKTRIFIVNQTDESNKYGVARYIETIISEVNRRNTYELVIVTIGVECIKSIQIKVSGNITSFNIPKALTNLYTSIQLSYWHSRAIFCLLNDYFILKKDDIFHFNSNMQHYIIKEIKSNTPAKIIYTIHVSLWQVFYENNYKKFIESFTDKNNESSHIRSIKAEIKNCELADLVICLNDKMKHDVINLYKIPKDKIRKVINGITVETYFTNNQQKLTEIKNDIGIEKNDFTMLYIGRITHQKGVEYLFRSFRELSKQKFNKIKLILIGDGDLQLKINKEYKDISHLYKFLGYIPPKQIECYYRLADMIIFPSLNEQSSYVMIEAMKYKVPLMVTEIEAFKHLINNETCIKVKLKNNNEVDVEDLTEKIKYIVKNRQVCIKIANNAYKLFENDYTSEKMFQLTYST